MDTFVCDGDFYKDSTYYPVSINSIEEACQRVRFCLLTKKGTFAYDRQLGADYDYLFLEENPNYRMFVIEAVSSQRDISIGDVSADIDSNQITLTIDVFFGEEHMNTEVIINGNI